MRWEKYGWQVGKITDVITKKTPQLFKKFNYRVIWADNQKGPSKLGVDSYGFHGESARINSWVILTAKQQGGAVFRWPNDTCMCVNSDVAGDMVGNGDQRCDRRCGRRMLCAMEGLRG
eukprot:6811102-Prymnesium_polylepis.1